MRAIEAGVWVWHHETEDKHAVTQTTAGIQAGISAMLSASDIPYFAPEETRRLFPVWTPLRFAVGVKSATLRFEHNPPYEVEDRTYFIVQIPFVQIALRL